MSKPIVKSVCVPVPPAAAFERFTAEIMSWWPIAKHSVSAGQGKMPQDIVFETRLGGAVYEILPDGSRSDWGEITRWQEGQGFAMTWHPGKGPEGATRLELQFESEGNGARVTLTHSGWEALAEQAETARSHYSSGWDHVLGDCFVQGVQ